jgi:hypothetical protein
VARLPSKTGASWLSASALLLVGRACRIAGTAFVRPTHAMLSPALDSQTGAQAAANTVLKAKSLSLAGQARTLPFWSTMVMASPEVSERGPLVV